MPPESVADRLRPIGSEFVSISYDTQSTNPGRHVLTHRVVAHVKTARFKGDIEGPVLERIEPIREEFTPGIVVEAIQFYAAGPTQTYRAVEAAASEGEKTT